MKIAVYGAGAIGGLLGTRLAAAGIGPVSAVARGATLAALRHHGWRVRQNGQVTQAAAGIVSDSPADLGAQDLVLIAVKGPAMAQVAASIRPLLGPDTMVLPAMNGVPWWFGQGIPALSAAPLTTVDPTGAVLTAIPADRVIGCVVHGSASAPEPGLVELRMFQELIIGEPSGVDSPRLTRLAQALATSGLKVSVSANIRHDIWFKLWGNMTMNPVSAITGATIDRMLGDPLVRQFCSSVMLEAAAIGARIGCVIDQSPEDRHAVTAKLGAFKTSMLQDVEAGRALELDAIVAVVREIATRLGMTTPNIDALLGLSRLFAQVRGLYPQG